MGSHPEGFKQGSDLTDLGRRCCRLPWAREEAGSQLLQLSWGSMRWLGLGDEALGDDWKGMNFELGIIPNITY